MANTDLDAPAHGHSETNPYTHACPNPHARSDTHAHPNPDPYAYTDSYTHTNAHAVTDGDSYSGNWDQWDGQTSQAGGGEDNEQHCYG